MPLPQHGIASPAGVGVPKVYTRKDTSRFDIYRWKALTLRETHYLNPRPPDLGLAVSLAPSSVSTEIGDKQIP